MTPLAACLIAVFLTAKTIALAGRAVPHSGWSPFVYVWQDVSVVFVFLGLQRVVRRFWVDRPVYALLVLLAAVDVPVMRVLSSPLTMPMVRAARGALSDSIRMYVTPANVGSIVVVLVVGVAFPLIPARRWPGWVRAPRAWSAVGVLVLCLGAVGASRVDTAGVERNPLVALVRTSFPRMRAHAGDADWRKSPFATDSGESLARLSASARERNVLFIVLESTGARYLRPFGAIEDPMPTLTALASRAIVFENAYAVYPESIKGFVSIIASRYPGFDVPAERLASAASPSLAATLSATGYRTALFHSGRFMYLGMDEVLAQSGFSLMEDAGAIGGERNSSFGIDEASTVRRILSWIDSVPRGQRFFAAYLPVAGHHPYASAGNGPFPDRDDLGRYRNALHEGDAALGVLLDGLRARGLDRSTLIVVLGDHGEAFGQHAGNYGHTLALYDENVHVPLMVAIPGVAGASGRVGRVVSLLDVAPTVLDLLGLPARPEFQGESALDGREHMALFFSDYSLGLLGLRDGCTKYIHELESGRSRTFDLCRDPDERVDLTPRLAGRDARYRARLLAWSAAEVARIRSGYRSSAMGGYRSSVDGTGGDRSTDRR